MVSAKGSNVLEKSVEVATAWIAQDPGLSGLAMVEGSGIAYTNRATAQAMAHALTLLKDDRRLLKVKNGSPHKTGTLKVTKSVVGFLDTKDAGVVRYVIVLGGDGFHTRWKVVNTIAAGLGGLK